MFRSFRDIKSSSRSSLSLEIKNVLIVLPNSAALHNEANLAHCLFFSACTHTVWFSIIALRLHYSVFMSAAFRDSGQTLMTSGALENWCCSVQSSRAHLCRKSMSIPSTRMRELKYLQARETYKTLKTTQGKSINHYCRCIVSAYLSANK